MGKDLFKRIQKIKMRTHIILALVIMSIGVNATDIGVATETWKKDWDAKYPAAKYEFTFGKEQMKVLQAKHDAMEHVLKTATTKEEVENQLRSTYLEFNQKLASRSIRANLEANGTKSYVSTDELDHNEHNSFGALIDVLRKEKEQKRRRLTASFCSSNKFFVCD